MADDIRYGEKHPPTCDCGACQAQKRQRDEWLSELRGAVEKGVEAAGLHEKIRALVDERDRARAELDLERGAFKKASAVLDEQLASTRGEIARLRVIRQVKVLVYYRKAHPVRGMISDPFSGDYESVDAMGERIEKELGNLATQGWKIAGTVCFMHGSLVYTLEREIEVKEIPR